VVYDSTVQIYLVVQGSGVLNVADKPEAGRSMKENSRESRMRENLTYGINEGVRETYL
jgi:hypothetical protein